MVIILSGSIRNHHYQTIYGYHVLGAQSEITIIRQYMVIMFSRSIGNHHYQTTCGCHVLGTNMNSPLSDNIWLSCSIDQPENIIIRQCLVMCYHFHRISESDFLEINQK